MDTRSLKKLIGEHGPVRPQEATAWRGTMPLPAELEAFYRDVGPLDVSIDSYGDSYFLPALAGLWPLQAGYRWNGISGEPIPNWPDEWLVVASAGGDPFIFVKDDGTILHAYHGAGRWETLQIFPHIEAMAACLGVLGQAWAACESSDADDEDDEDALLERQLKAACRMARPTLVEILGARAKASLVLARLGWS